MKRKSSRLLVFLKRRARAAAKVRTLAEVLRGTLRQRYVRCGKANCHCQKGRGHGPFLYLSVSLGVGKSEQITIAPPDAALARRFVGNYHRLRRVLERVSDINRQLLRKRLLKYSRVGREVALSSGRKRREKKG